jgi:hypothetical protein
VAIHPPAARRAVIRSLKAGEHPVQLLKAAEAITDPTHTAAALAHLANDERLPAGKSAELIRKTIPLLRKEERPGRMAEAWGDVLEQAIRLQRGPETTRAVEKVQGAAVHAICALPNGRWVTDCIQAMAANLTSEGREKLLRRALQNPGGELEGARTLLAIDPGLQPIVRDHAPPEVASRLIAVHAGADSNEAVEAAWAIVDIGKRREALRVLASKMDEPHKLMALGASSKDRPPAEQVACWTVVGARLDRLGQGSEQAFNLASRALFDMEGPDAIKAHKKLAIAMERSGLEAPIAPEVADEQFTGTRNLEVPIKPLERHAFALVDGYTGGLGAPHLRAIARAAPLCMAFDLDLVLMGFPIESAKELVSLVEAESNVGEGEGYTQQLLEQDRLHLAPLSHGVPKVWPGTPVATTPHPAPGKAVALTDITGPICLLIGQGKQGLPKRMLNVVAHHHELTGRGISMETATAMGILADRLGQLPTQ